MASVGSFVGEDFGVSRLVHMSQGYHKKNPDAKNGGFSYWDYFLAVFTASEIFGFWLNFWMSCSSWLYIWIYFESVIILLASAI